MNLWGRIAGFVLLALVFVVACREDELSKIGFPSQADKFKVSYVEIPLPSSVMAYDSVQTFTDRNQQLERRRLVGRYVDNRFGEITAEAFTQFGPVEPNIDIPDNTEVISAFLVLSYDFYHYGGNEAGTNTFTVHELLDSIPPLNPEDVPIGQARSNSFIPYFFDSSIPFEPTPIGSVTFQVDPLIFDQTASDIRNNPSSLKHDEIDSLSVQLNDDFATRLFEFARDESRKADYSNQRRFRRIFKGLAIRPGISDSKVIGFNPRIDTTQFTKSRIILNYNEIDLSTGDKTRKVLEYSIFELDSGIPVLGFSKISANRSGTVLSSVSDVYQEYQPDENGYYQSGNPITTKVVFDKFLEFADTIPNLIFNSVELSIDVDDAETFAPPSKLRLRYLNSKNKFVNFYSNIPEEQQFPAYPASMTYDEAGWYIIGQRLNTNTVGSLFDINYNPEARRYSGDLTDYFQTLYNIKDEEFRHTDYCLTARSPLEGISVNRLVFKKENIKLKIFYTVPVLDPLSNN